VVGNLIELTIAGGRNGVALEENSADCVVLENTIVGTAPGLSGEPGSLGGIHVGSGCDRAVVRENQIIGGSGPGVGLGSVAANGGSLGGVSGVSIDRNEIREMASNGVGVLSFERPDLTAPAPITDELTVSGNKIEGCAFAPAQPIVVSTGGLAAAQQVKLAGGVALWMGEQIRLLDNDIHDNGRRLEARAPNPVAGVVLYNPGSRLTISRNRILDNVGTAGPLSGGIVVAQSMAVEPTQPVCIIAHNEVAALAGPALSVAATAAGAAITMANNVLRCAEHHDAAISVKAAEAVVQFNQNEVESLTDLSLPAPAAILIDGVHITFSGNHCVWRTPVPGRTHVFLHTPRSTTAIGNHCLEPQPGHLTSLELQGPATGIVVVGNITTSLLSSPAPATTVANITGVTL